MMKSADDGFLTWLIRNLASYSIIGINYLLEYLFTYFTEYEKHNTKGEYLGYFVKRLGFAQFFNTTILSLLFAMQKGNIWGLGGLTSTVYYIFVNNALIPIITALISQEFWIKALKRQWYRWRQDKTKMMQKELDE